MSQNHSLDWINVSIEVNVINSNTTNLGSSRVHRQQPPVNVCSIPNIRGVTIFGGCV